MAEMSQNDDVVRAETAAEGATPAPGEPDGPRAAGGAESSAGEQMFTIKYMGEEIAVTRDELIRLAQKGRDYDRIRSRAEMLAEKLRQLEGGAAHKGADSAEAALSEEKERAGGAAAREDKHGGAQGLRAPEEGEQVPDDKKARPDTAESAFAESGLPGGAEAGERAGEHFMDAPGESRQSADALRREREIDEFMRVYGPVEPEAIPEAVWREVGRGVPLLAAYQAYENRLLRAALAAERLARSNALRSVGSGATAGGLIAGDLIVEDWYKRD